MSLSVETWLRFIVWLVIGFLIYFTYGAKHSRLRLADEADQVKPDQNSSEVVPT